MWAKRCVPTLCADLRFEFHVLQWPDLTVTKLYNSTLFITHSQTIISSSGNTTSLTNSLFFYWNYLPLPAPGVTGVMPPDLHIKWHSHKLFTKPSIHEKKICFCCFVCCLFACLLVCLFLFVCYKYCGNLLHSISLIFYHMWWQR